MTLPKVSIIIPAYNCEKTILGTIKNCLNQSHPDCEVIVVDDGSGDSTGNLLNAQEKIKYIRQANCGPAAARNRGAAQAVGVVLAFTDSDCAPHQDWIECLLKHFDRENAGAVAGSYGIINENDLLARCIHNEILYRHKKLIKDKTGAFGSYNCAVKKELFDGLGGFDESYPEASGEDNDLSYRIIEQGRHIYFAPDALVDHYHTHCSFKYLREQFRHGFWRAKLYLVHPAMAKGDNYTFWKDPLEMFLSFLVCFGFAGLFFNFWFGLPLAVLALVFFIFEFVFSLVMQKTLFDAFFFSIIMLLRSFARLFGLATGFLRFLFLPPKKKR